MKKLLFLLTMICLISSCNKTPVITLSVDKSEIFANGEELAKFTVICNDEDDVTDACRIFFADSKEELGATSFSTTEPKTYSFYATYDDVTSETVTIKAIEAEVIEEEKPIVLNASTDTIIANGIDAVTFTVMQEDINITSSSEIFVNDNAIEGNEFTTKVAGSYTIVAKKNDTLVSNEIVIIATENPENPDDLERPISLSASTDTIVANGIDAVTFTVKQNGLNITSISKIFVNDKAIEGNKFTTDIAGSYTIVAKKNDTLVSNEIVIIATENPEEPEEKPIIISANTTTIIANGEDAVTFTVKQDNKDVTNESEIFVNDNKITGNKFTSSTAGIYKAYAKKGEMKSNEINIIVNEVPIEPEKPIEITADKTNINANGIDEVTFTVTQEGNNVTNQSEIYVNGGKINGNKFNTYTAGTYKVFAKKNDATSNEITITAEAVEGDKTVVFAEGVTMNSGWYDVNKLKIGGADVNMCWAASASNMIQWWQDRYVAAGNTLPAGAVTGPGTKVYEGYCYNLALMELYRDLWNNISEGGYPDHGVIWYFEGRNVYSSFPDGYCPQPAAAGGYYSNVWNQILPYVYQYTDNLISTEINNYYEWGNGTSLNAQQRLKKFSDYVVESIERGVTSLTISLNSNGGLLHATTLWGYEIDNATGMLTKIWLTDSDDIHQGNTSGDPTQQMLREYSVSYDSSCNKVKFTGEPYGACWAISLYPVSGYKKN